ncbi:MAG: lipid-A-disaccharide synthase [Candidatus Eisenbacteria bacterium]
MGEPLAKRLLIVTGEASGDLHASRLVEALRAHGRFEARGVAGPCLRAAGVEPLVAAEDLAVLGFSGVLAKLPRLLDTRRRLLATRDSWRPDAVVLVDYPGFNLRIGPALKSGGARIFYYIAPQVWAWHPERARAMARWVDRLAVVFPFEEPIFREAGVPTVHVGHPLLDELAPETDETTFRRELGLPAGARILGLLPGSRAQEIHRHLDRMLAAAARLAAERPDLHAVVALPPDPTIDTPEAAGPRPGWLRVVRGRTRSVQRWATCCAVASGTATLETALFGTPLAIVYRVGWLNYQIARRLVSIDHIGLPNIVAGAPVAPELIQHAFTPARLAETLAPWLDDPSERERRSRLLATVRKRLGTPGASARAAAALWDLVS